MSKGMNVNVVELLEYLQDTVENAAKVPMSGKVMLDKKDICDVIDQIINYLPDDFKKAKWITAEKDRILGEAQREYDKAQKEREQAKKDTVEFIKKEIENHDIVKDAKSKAQEIRNIAKKEAKEMRLGARDYSKDVLIELDDEILKKKEELILNLQTSFKIAASDVEKNMNTMSATINKDINVLKEMKK